MYGILRIEWRSFAKMFHESNFIEFRSEKQSQRRSRKNWSKEGGVKLEGYYLYKNNFILDAGILFIFGMTY